MGGPRHARARRGRGAVSIAVVVRIGCHRQRLGAHLRLARHRQVADPNRTADHHCAPAIGRNRHVGRAGHDARWAVARSSRIPSHRPSPAAARSDTIHRTQTWVGRGRVGRSDQPGGCGPHMAGLHSDALPGSGRTRHRTDGSRAKQPLQVLALHCLSAGTGGHLLRGRQ